MNSYLSKAEKANMTRLMLLVELMGRVVEDYEKVGNADAEFMRSLRTCKTWGYKAIKRRYDFLEADAAKDFTR
ncbi:MAG: hypothetical protein IJ709_08760, partial [Selenomonas sp.]|nr:hypothetical protein [Selenomonas sp.]